MYRVFARWTAVATLGLSAAAVLAQTPPRPAPPGQVQPLPLRPPRAIAPADSVAAPTAIPVPAPATLGVPIAGPGEVRALVVAEMEATISSQFAGRLISMPKQVGDSFKQGELLAAFDCSERQATVKVAQAELLSARETHLARLKLQSLGAASDLDVTVAAAAAAKARSQLELARTQEQYCVVHAPYPGKVVRMRAKAFESVNLGQPLLEIVNPASLRAQLFVPSAWLRWLKPGANFTLTVDETGSSYRAKIAKISSRIDGSSQTVEVTGRFDRVPVNVLPGMIGKAVFDGAR
ncbi:efflux RND transporter periplasmic adaptor subunit [Ramlibacter sp.]|uniref:efflux RND transporter periplasmic adaptor subunit n=1 Tax=Ramlibacter sp. TaxID=1917967 RepID=UPI003D0F969E